MNFDQAQTEEQTVIPKVYNMFLTKVCCRISNLDKSRYRKFSNKGAPLTPGLLGFWSFLAIS